MTSNMYPALGRYPTGQWPGEASSLVLGIFAIQAKNLGESPGQHTYLWATEEATPELVLLSPVTAKRLPRQVHPGCHPVVMRVAGMCRNRWVDRKEFHAGFIQFGARN